MAKRKFRSARGQPRATLSQKTRRRSPETVANLICSRSTLSLKTRRRSPKTVVKPYIFHCAKGIGRCPIDSYIFAYAAVAKRTFSHLGVHGAVVRGTFAFWWMNPLAGIGVSIARNCSETQILSSRICSAHCNGRVNAHDMEP